MQIHYRVDATRDRYCQMPPSPIHLISHQPRRGVIIIATRQNPEGVTLLYNRGNRRYQTPKGWHKIIFLTQYHPFGVPFRRLLSCYNNNTPSGFVRHAKQSCWFCEGGVSDNHDQAIHKTMIHNASIVIQFQLQYDLSQSRRDDIIIE